MGFEIAIESTVTASQVSIFFIQLMISSSINKQEGI